MQDPRVQSTVRRFLAAWSILGLDWIIGVAGPVHGQGGAPRRVDGPTTVERSYLTDFRTLYECLERAALDHGMRISSSGHSSSWLDVGQRNTWRFVGQGAGNNEGFEVVADERKYPWLKDRPLAHLDGPRPRAARKMAEPPKIILDLETGELTTRDGAATGGGQITRIRLNVTLEGEKGSNQLLLIRDFKDKYIKISVDNRLGARVNWREFLASLDSKLKVASRLREAKAKREKRPEVQPVKPE